MRTRVAIIIVVSGLLLWSWPLASTKAQSPAPLRAKIVAHGEPVRVQLIPGLLLSLPLYVAADEGMFAAHGLKPVLMALATGPLGMQALASGSIDIGGTGTDVIMTAYAKHADIQVIVGMVKTNTNTIEVSNKVPLPHLKDGYPQVMQDIKGIVLGVSALGSSGELYARAAFSGAKIDPTTIHFLAVGSSVTAYPAILAGKIQGYMATEPMITLCKIERTCALVLDFRKGEGPEEIAKINGASLSFAAQRSYINQHPTVVGAFTEAIQDAIEWMQNPRNFDKLLGVAKSHIGLGSAPHPDVLLSTMVRDNLPYFGATISRPAIASLSNFLFANKRIPTEVDPEKFVYSKAPQPTR